MHCVDFKTVSPYDHITRVLVMPHMTASASGKPAPEIGGFLHIAMPGTI